MRKLMIAMLALAVVFGFAACDNSNSGSTSLMDKYVVALEITEGPTQYFDGDTLDKDQYTVMATQNDGQKVQLASSDFTFSPADGKVTADADVANADAKEKTIGTFTYSGVYQGTLAPVTVDVKATVYSIDGINVSGPDLGQYWNSDTVADLDASAYTVTAYALAKATDTIESTPIFSKAYTSDDFEMKCGSLTNATDKLPAGLQTLTFTVNTKGTAIKGGSATAEINVKVDSVKSISIALKDNVEAVIGMTNQKAEDDVDVTYALESGKTVTDPTGYGKAATVKWSNGSMETSKTFADATPQPVEAAIDGTDIKTSGVSVVAVNNYIKSFTVTVAPAAESDMKLVAGTEVDEKTLQVKKGADSAYVIDLANLSVATTNLTWASGSAPADFDAETLKDALKMQVNGADAAKFDTTGYEATAKLPVTFSLTGVAGVTDKTACAVTAVELVAALQS